MSVVLVRVKSSGPSKELPLSEGTAVVGRDVGCGVRIAVAAVSRRHCQFMVNDGRVIVKDLGSSNGTFVNGQAITGEEELEPGDVVAIGPIVFVTRIDGDPTEIDADAALNVAKQATATPYRPAPASPPPSSLLSDSPLAELDPDDSSMFDFDFDPNEDEDDEQPPL